jgi:hypothetical protein
MRAFEFLNESAYVSEGIQVMSLDQFVQQADDLEEAAPKLGAQYRTMDEPEMVSYMDRVLAKKKEKQDKFKRPYLHGGNIPIVNDQGKKYDLEALKSAIVTRPTKILKQNEKMVHSDGTSSIFFNVGLPALVGLAVNEDTGEFIVVNTCPGAGACKTYCYAMKGGYVQWKASSMSQTKMLNFLVNDPDGFSQMLASEIAAAEKKFGKKGTKVIIRWHDAGDFFSPEYLDLAYNVARQFPDVDFYAYTKMASVAQANRPSNFKMNFSQGAHTSQEKKIDFTRTKHSKVVPKDLFKDHLAKDEAGKWQFISPDDQQAVKNNIANTYKIDPKSILTYDEMMAKKEVPGGQWNVIVKPGDGDDSANRADVLGTYLLFH